MEVELKPLANYLLVSVPERFITHHKKGAEGLLIKSAVLSPGLMEQIQAGYGDIPFELDEAAERTMVREGQVLALPPVLNEDLYVCAGPGEKPRTGADIHPEIEVGDTVHLDSAYLTDENEIQPGIYRLPYTAVIARIEESELEGKKYHRLHPIGGYALLSRAYREDFHVLQDIDGRQERCTEVNGIWEVAQPIRNEGIVERLSTPLGKTPQWLQTNDRVLFEGYPRLETIRGTEYIVVQQDTIAAVLDRKEVDYSQINAPFTEQDELDMIVGNRPEDAAALQSTAGTFVHYERSILPLDSPSYLA